MRAIFFSVAAIASLAACDAPSTTSQTGGAAQKTGVPAAEEPVTSLAAIEGRWAIVRFGQFEPSWRTNIGWRAAYVNVDADSLGYSIGCNHSGSRARIDGNGVLHTENDSPSTLMGCPADAAVKDHDFYAFFRTKPRITRIGEERIRLANGVTELILERPEIRRRADPPRPQDIRGRWVPQFLDDFSGAGMSGFSMEEPRGVVTISDVAISWSGCPDATVSIRYSNDFRLEPRSRPKGTCRIGEQPGQDGATKLMRLMRSNPAVERTGQDTIVLFTDNEAVHLQTEKSALTPPQPVPAAEAAGSPPPPPDFPPG